MQIDQAGIDLIKNFEGFRSSPYQDQRGRWTIGFGHTENVTEDSRPISEMQGDILLEEDVEAIEGEVDDLVKVPLKQSEFNALVSFCFNEGIGRFRSSTLLSKLNLGDRRGAGKEFLKWVYIHKDGDAVIDPGLVKRRCLESTLFLSELVQTSEG